MAESSFLGNFKVHPDLVIDITGTSINGCNPAGEPLLKFTTEPDGSLMLVAITLKHFKCESPNKNVLGSAVILVKGPEPKT